jgi:hypothetical protein
LLYHQHDNFHSHILHHPPFSCPSDALALGLLLFDFQNCNLLLFRYLVPLWSWKRLAPKLSPDNGVHWLHKQDIHLLK